jgi:LPXTG-site transpeptidase (sortase) family protein
MMEVSEQLPKRNSSSNWMIVGGIILVILGITSFVLSSLQVWPFLPEDTFEADNNNFLSSDSTVPTLNVPQLPKKTSSGVIPAFTQSPNTTPSGTQIIGTPEPTSIITPEPTENITYVPDRIIIPSINLDAPIVHATNGKLSVDKQKFDSWQAPDEMAVGWHDTSMTLGLPGNTVLDGHNSYMVGGEVVDGIFANLVNVKPGDDLVLYSGDKGFHYIIAVKMLFKERWQPVSVRIENSRWLGHSDDERITLVTCWPKKSNTHRLIVVALPYQN